MSSHGSVSGRPYVGVPTPTLVYVGVPDRADFDRIKGDCTPIEGGFAKAVKSDDGVTVIFQHWEDA